MCYTLAHGVSVNLLARGTGAQGAKYVEPGWRLVFGGSRQEYHETLFCMRDLSGDIEGSTDVRLDLTRGFLRVLASPAG